MNEDAKDAEIGLIPTGESPGASDDLVSFNEMMCDYYPGPGQRVKQYVVDSRRETAWEYETCPRFDGTPHRDNTDTSCRNSYSAVPWVDLDHDCCGVCGDQYEALRSNEQVRTWLAEKAKRPAVCEDRTKLSDEVAEMVNLAEHPLFARRR